MAAGLQLKNHLTSKDATVKDLYQQRWLALPNDIKIFVKTKVSFLSIDLSLGILYCKYWNDANKLINQLVYRFLELWELRR